ncbi:ergosterol biosynthesis protein [Elasticomyces elasticus]|nr:ergosterol biosynthesis protein [Elasticomyces elasticus]
MDSLLRILPQTPGLLPKWLLFVSIVSLGNSIQTYISTNPTKQVYSRAQSSITPLGARTFGTWTATAAIIRLYAAYNTDNKVAYELGMWAFGVAWLHYAAEWFAYGTVEWGRGLAGPACISTGSLVWMYLQRAAYVGS